MVKVLWLDGQSHVYALTGSQPSSALIRVGVTRRLVPFYLGIEHILLGVDHLLFVLGLLLIVVTAGC